MLCIDYHTPQSKFSYAFQDRCLCSCLRWRSIPGPFVLGNMGRVDVIRKRVQGKDTSAPGNVLTMRDPCETTCKCSYLALVVGILLGQTSERASCHLLIESFEYFLLAFIQIYQYCEPFAIVSRSCQPPPSDQRIGLNFKMLPKHRNERVQTLDEVSQP